MWRRGMMTKLLSAILTYATVLIGCYPIPAMALTTDAPPAPENQDEGLDHLLQRTAAARLLAAMGPNTPIDTKVSRLIDRLVLRDRDQVQAAVTALDMLGPPAVPAIIQRIDDRRNMKVHTAT